MQSAGFTGTPAHPPILNLAKAPKPRQQAEHPHFVYSMLALVFYSSISALADLLSLSSNLIKPLFLPYPFNLSQN